MDPISARISARSNLSSSPNERLGSPVFLLRPPDMSANSRQPSVADGESPSPGLAEGSRRYRGRLRPKAESDVTTTPTRHAQRFSNGSAGRPPWTPPGTAPAHPSGLQPSGLPPLSRPPAHDEAPLHRRDVEPTWTTNGSQPSQPSGGGHSSNGGWGSSGGGAPQAGISSGGMGGPAQGGGRPANGSFNATLKRPEYTARTPLNATSFQEGSFNATPSPVSSTMAQYPPYSGEKPANMPEYLKVFTVPKDVRYEEDVVIEPIIQSLGVGDKQMEQRITEQMSNLHDFFRRLYDQDQEEIRCLQAQMEQRDMELRRLRRLKVAANKDDNKSPCSPKSPEKGRRRRLAEVEDVKDQAASPLAGAESKPMVALVMPPVTNPVRPFYKWWANIDSFYRRRTTAVLGGVFVLLLILSVGLLAGLLSHNSSSGSSPSSSLPPFHGAGPRVTALWSSGLAFSVNMSEGASTFYALVPAGILASANYTPSASDVRALLQGPTVAPLQSMAVACGERTAVQTRSFTFAVTGSSAPQEATVGATSCEVPGALPGRCSLCPDVRAASSYVLLVAFTNSEALFQLPVTTAMPDANNGTTSSTSLPPSPSPPPPPPSLPPPSPSPPTPSPPSPPLPSPPLPPTPPLSPGALPPAPVFTATPAVVATGPASLGLTFTLSGPGVVQYLVMHPVLYAQAGGQLVSYASTDPVAGQPLTMSPAPNANVVGVGGIVAAGVVNATQSGLPYTLRVDGLLSGTVNGTASCACGAGACNCTASAPCLGDLCGAGPSGLTANTIYKVFVSVSSPDGTSSTNGPYSLGTVTTALDNTAPALSPAAAISPATVTSSNFSVSGLQLDTAGLAYILVSKALSGQQQGVAAGTATAFTEQAATRRRLAGFNQRSELKRMRGGTLDVSRFGAGSRRALLQSSGSGTNFTSAGLVALDPAPIAQVFTPTCPRTVPCDTAQAVSTYLDASTEALAAVRCLVLFNTRDSGATAVLGGLANDTTYIVRVVTEDELRNQRMYRAVVHTVDLRPPDIVNVAVQSSFTAFNLTVTLSEPGSLVGFLYTAAGAANISRVATSWPPSPQGSVVQQVTVFSPSSGNVSALSGNTTYLLSFTDPSIAPKTNYSVALVARDLAGNLQPQVTVQPVLTDDNVPPVWVAANVAPQAYEANVTMQLDEQSTLFWFCFAGNTTCPTATKLWAAVDAPSTTLSGLVNNGSASVQSGTPTSTLVSGLYDGTAYTLCMVAQDTAPLRNRQTAVRRLMFATPDRTPPTLLVSVVPGTDGNFTCDRSTFLCRLSLNVSLSESGTTLLALQYADPRVVNFTAANLTSMNLTAPATGVLNAAAVNFTGPSSKTINLGTLTSGRTYGLDLAAVDSSGNVQQRLSSFTLTAPDVTPPAFTSYSAASTADTFITINVSLSEASNISWVVLPTGSTAPNATQLLAAAGSGKVLTGTVTYAPNATGALFAWSVNGLSVGTVYDIYMIAKDTSGNQQANVTSILRVRVQDSTPPVILSLATSAAQTGNRLKITANSTKPGTLWYIAVRSGSQAPTKQQLLQPSTYPGAANFSGQLSVPSALSAASTVLCVADSGSFDIWALQQDLEGTFPNRQPNYSNVTRAVQLPLTDSTSATCFPEARMQSLLLGTALTSGSLGWPVGRLTPVASTSGNASWVRDYMLIGGLGGGVGIGGTLTASMEGYQLGTFDFQPARPAPAQIRVALQTPTLYLELPAAASGTAADPGNTLRFAYQLLDSAGRPTGSSGLRIVPSLITSKTGKLVLSNCSITAVTFSTDVSAALPQAGAGVCRVVVPSQVFPAAGSALNGTLQVDVYNGSVLLTSSTQVQVGLRSAAVASYTVPSNGLLFVALPSRPVRPGETFRVTLSAAVISQQIMTGYTIQLLFNASRVAFVSAVQSDMWSDLSTSLLGAGTANTMQLGLTSITRAASDYMYQNRTVALVDVYFRLVNNTGPDGAELAVLSIGSNSALHPASGAPAVLYSNFRANSTAGSVQVASASQLSLFVYLPNHDVFNSAVIDGSNVVVPVQGLVVSDWAATATPDGTLVYTDLSKCSCVAAANMSRAFSLNGCRLNLSAIHSQPVKQAPISVVCGNTTALQAQAVVTVWYPSSFRVEASDPDSTLSSLLPINVPEPAAGSCQDRYQNTQISLLATWSNGGNATSDVLSDTDVTPLVANWTTDAPDSLWLSGATATGLSAHPGANVSAVSTGGRVLATTQLAVSDEPVCVESLEAVALSKVTMTGETVPSSLGRWRVRFTPQQALTWERASAKVSVFATLSDTTVMAVSGASSTTTVQLPGIANGTLPFSLQPLVGYPSLDLEANVSFGAPPACGPYLRTSWSVCSGSGNNVLMAAGTGTVRVVLPTPTGIAALLPSSAIIAGSGSGAELPPINVPTRASLQVLVAFDDGLRRDLSTDSRVQVVVVLGADLCRVGRDTSTNQPYVEAIGSPGMGGTCGLEARATFANLPQLVGGNTTTVVTLTSLQVYVTDSTRALPPTTDSNSVTDLASINRPLRLFKCDFSHYQPASVWVMGLLSSGGDLVDLNNQTLTKLTLSDKTAVDLAVNPANTSLTNVLQPYKPGQSILAVKFTGYAGINPTFTVSVEDTYQAGWPRVTAVTDAGFTIAANMTSDTFQVTYLVLTAATAQSAPPTADVVQQAGVVMAYDTSGGPFFLTETLTNLAPATNYTVFLAVSSGSQLISTVVAISGVLTTDTMAPSFTSVGTPQGPTVDTQRFMLRVPVALSESGTINYLVYRNSSCINGTGSLPVSTVLGASQLPSGMCGCADTTACQPVASGNITLSGSQLNDTLTLSGLLPPNPYNVLSGASQDQLTCRPASSLPAPVSTTHLLYLVAQDDMPTYKGWNVTCTPPSSSPGSSCNATASAPCTAVPPPSGSGGNNLQALPYTSMQLGTQATIAQGSPVLATFNLPSGDPVAFDPTGTSINATSHTITFTFKVNKISAVQYRLDQFNGTSVFSGMYPVFDPSVSYRVSISKTCSGTLLAEPSYTLWYWATDVYGKSSAALSVSIVFS